MTFDWFNQSRTYLDKVYAYTSDISESYINSGIAIIEKQLYYAGIRLANVLNIVFGK